MREDKMQKYAYLVLATVIVAIVAIGCAGEPEKEPVEVTAPPEYEIIDHKTRDFGGQVPQWVTKSASELESESRYQEFYVFMDDQVGQDLEGLKLWARGFSISSEIARLVSTRVEDKFVGAAAGDRNALETYLEEVVKSVSEAQYSGARVEEDFWVKRRKNSDNTEDYRYLFLVTVPKQQIDDAIRRAIEAADREDRPTPDKQTAIDRVKAAFDEGL
jgi:hypothetical protein